MKVINKEVVSPKIFVMGEIKVSVRTLGRKIVFGEEKIVLSSSTLLGSFCE